MITVQGRVLDGPGSVMYGRSKSLMPKFGSWNLIDCTYTKVGVLPKWKYIFIQNTESEADLGGLRDPLISEFNQGLRKIGMDVKTPVPAELLRWQNQRSKPGSTSDEIERLNDTAIMNLFERLIKDGFGLVVIVLPRADHAFAYSSIKYNGDVKFGLHTVCMQYAKVSRQSKRDQYIANVTMKLNLKLGGVNHQLPTQKLGMLSKPGTIIFGMDVTHPSPGSQEGAPSIAAVVSSVDNLYGQWPAQIRAQTGGQEMIDSLDAMVTEQIRLYYLRNNNNLPYNVLVYRDGVSDGQYQTVLDVEVRALEEALHRIYTTKIKVSYVPKVTVLIVGKRHHTRFYPTASQDADRNGNPRNGTIVDRGITMERGWDFFLQAHVGLQGTARPAHYVVLKNGMGLRVDEVESITHNLCYLFGRATKAVSICPPAYYADLLAERGRKYVSGLGKESRFEWREHWTGGVHERLRGSMFYI